MSDPRSSTFARREFLRTGAAAAAGLAAVPGALRAGLFAPGTGTLKVGLIGCGGRGTGAAAQALAADPDVKLTAMGDTFEDKLKYSLDNLKASGVGGKVDVPPERQFVGFDAYQKVIDSGVDVVLLTAPPHFRPEHLRAAVAAGKHIFCEKPVAVDAPGVRSVFATVEEAAKKGLSLVSGLCWRYDHGMRATFQQILEGGVGELVAIQATYNASTLKKYPRQPGWSDMEFQVRNWQHMVWLSGDFNTEQHVHSLDKVLWAMNNEAPVRASGVGGRQAREGAESGNVYDHFSVVYEFANGLKAFATCRQMDGCTIDVSDHVFGTKGTCDVFAHRIQGEKNWRFRGDKGNMYQTEHDELFASIRSGKPINNGDYMTKSTMMAILGRMSAYTGRTLTWNEAMNSTQVLGPSKYEFTSLDLDPVAVPGVTQFV